MEPVHRSRGLIRDRGGAPLTPRCSRRDPRPSPTRRARRSADLPAGRSVLDGRQERTCPRARVPPPPVDAQQLRRRLDIALAGCVAGAFSTRIWRRLAAPVQQARARSVVATGPRAALSPRWSASLPRCGRPGPGRGQAQTRRRGPPRSPGGHHLRERSSTAIQEFMDGRYAVANRHLNEILRLIATGARGTKHGCIDSWPSAAARLRAVLEHTRRCAPA